MDRQEYILEGAVLQEEGEDEWWEMVRTPRKEEEDLGIMHSVYGVGKRDGAMQTDLLTTDQ